MSSRTRPTTLSLLLDNHMFPRNADHLCARVFALDLARHKRHQSTEDQGKGADPDPRNQRKYVGLNRGVIAVRARKIQIKIFVQTLPDGYFVRGLAAGFVNPALGLEHAQTLAILPDFDGGILPEVIVVFAFVNRVDGELIGSDAHRVAGLYVIHASEV